MDRYEESETSPAFQAKLADAWDREAFFAPQEFAADVSRKCGLDSILRAFMRCEALCKRTELLKDGGRAAWPATDGTIQPNVSTIVDALASGCSVLARRFDQDHDGVADITRAIQRVIDHPVFATLFLTNVTENAFPAHFDSADVIAIQLGGEKRWELFGREDPPPLDDADLRAVQSVDEPRLDVTLAPGDALYVPRGMIHRVRAVTLPSVHISIGIKVTTAGDAAVRLLETVKRVGSFRDALPRELAEISIEALAENCDIGKILELTTAEDLARLLQPRKVARLDELLDKLLHQGGGGTAS